MLFVHGFCLTEADGTSPVEWLEPRWSAPLRVVSGPAATSYGGATAAPSSSNLTFNQEWPKSGLPLGRQGVQAVCNRTPACRRPNEDGRRVWRMPKTQATARGKATSAGRPNCRRWQGDKATHHTWLAVLDASWDLPGSVDSLTAAETPEFAPGGQYNAHVQRRRALAGHHVHVSDVTVFGIEAPSTSGH